MTAIEIAGRKIGAGQPCFVIAEAGVNHNGSVEFACRLVDAAVKAGADAVKFQTFLTEDLVTEDAGKADYQERVMGAAESQFEMLKRLELSREDHLIVAAYARRKGILFLSTPFDEGSVELLEQMGVAAYKISSGDLTNLSLLEYIARKNRPMILSTGMANLDETAEAVAAIRRAGLPPLAILHCVSCYPARPETVNLRAMQTMAAKFEVPIGFSDHTLGLEIALASVAAGACILEKHLTLDCAMRGPDHQASLDPVSFGALMRGVRLIDAALGDGRKEPLPEEASTARVARKSVVAAKPIAAGEPLSNDALAIKRPGHGFAPALRSSLVGRVALVAIPAGAVLTPEMLS